MRVLPSGLSVKRKSAGGQGQRWKRSRTKQTLTLLICEEDRGICLHFPPSQDSPLQEMNCGSDRLSPLTTGKSELVVRSGVDPLVDWEEQKASRGRGRGRRGGGREGVE